MLCISVYDKNKLYSSPGIRYDFRDRDTITIDILSYLVAEFNVIMWSDAFPTLSLWIRNSIANEEGNCGLLKVVISEAPLLAAGYFTSFTIKTGSVCSRIQKKSRISTIRLGTIQLSTIQLSSIRFNTIRINTIRLRSYLLNIVLEVKKLRIEPAQNHNRFP